ncbi:2OG-Fe(II) oxygenase [Tranquillimonas rosea]|nr:2OG-Fe(II) oxygenase [Tranquillimonas rosea]
MIHTHSIPGAFSDAECLRIVAQADAAPAAEARLVGRARDDNQRRSELVWLDDVPEAGWVMDRIIDIVREANRDAFGFDLTEFAESAQVARYGADREGHFHWHADIGDGAVAGRRKLTIVIQLSLPEMYAGGALEVMPSARTVTAPRERGAACLFPSFLLHRVTPVTEGARRSLTVWAHGPAFR